MATLEPLIFEHIKTGSIIMWDQWNYELHIINHSMALVDDWVHTQTVDRFLGDLKELVKIRGVNKKVEQHLYTFLFIKKISQKYFTPPAGKSFPFSRLITKP